MFNFTKDEQITNNENEYEREAFSPLIWVED